jgi:hypothetical protein
MQRMSIEFEGLRDRIESVKKFRPVYVDLPLDYAEALLRELDRLRTFEQGVLKKPEAALR